MTTATIALAELAEKGADIDVQTRVVQAVQAIAQSDQSHGLIAIVSHGAVGTLLYCHLAAEPIDRRRDQPANGGDNWFRFSMSPNRVLDWWPAIDGLQQP